MPSSAETATALSESGIQPRAHSRSGIRRILEFPWIYAALHSLLRSPAAREAFVKDFVPVPPGSRLLDIGCGPAWILDFLPHNLHYVGYDINPRYVTTAQQRYGDRATFFCADIAEQLPPPAEGARFDFVLALGLLHHLNDAEATRVCATAFAHLKRGGVFITFDGVYVPDQSPIARYLISRDRGQAVRTAAGYLALTEPHFGDVKHQVRTDLLRIPYTHFLMHCVK